MVTTLTIFGHAHRETLLETTVLTSISCDFVDFTLFVSVTRVLHGFLDTSPEETLQKVEEDEQ